MTPPKHPTQTELTVMMHQLISAAEMFMRERDSEAHAIYLCEAIKMARQMITPVEFVAERCPNTDDMFNQKGESHGREI